MAKTSREGLHMVETDLEEMDEKIHHHRKKVFRIVMAIVGILVVSAICYELYLEAKCYTSYEVTSTSDRTDSEAQHFVTLMGNIVKYSNDGIVCMNEHNELLWNRAFEMTAPQVAVCESYLVVYDKGGTRIIIAKDTGIQKEIETTIPIETVCVANQGTIAALLKEDTTATVQLYDRQGKELAKGKFYAKQGGIPIDIAFSYDAKKLAVDMIDVSDGNLKSNITFYNFGSVGQNEINNNVGMFSYADMLIPEIEYVSANRMVALGDNEIVVFEGDQKPSVAKEIFLTEQVKDIVYNSKYIAVITDNHEDLASYHIKMYDLKGAQMMEVDTLMQYNKLSFLANNELCLLSDRTCEIYTIHGVRRFAYDFEKPVYEIMSKETKARYVFVLEGATEEVRLR